MGASSTIDIENNGITRKTYHDVTVIQKIVVIEK